MDAIKTDDIIKDLLTEKCRLLEQRLSGEVLLIRAPMVNPLDDVVRREVESLTSAEKCNSQLIVVLETNGGSVEVVERISDVFRHHFQTVVFVVPNFAYSAGTVLCLSGDEIYMDYYSVLGPIDPQIMNPDGRPVPGLGYLEKYDDLIQRSIRDELSLAELEFLVRKFDPADLFALEQAKNHSKDLIEKWLCKYKFKDWNTREQSGVPVTEEDKVARAGEIAELLSDPTEWKSHGRGIPLRTLTSELIKLKIEDFGIQPDLNKTIREYYDLFIDYCGKIGVEFALHTKIRFLPLGG